MLLIIGPLHNGQTGEGGAISSRIHDLHSLFLHLQMGTGATSGLVASVSCIGIFTSGGILLTVSQKDTRINISDIPEIYQEPGERVHKVVKGAWEEEEKEQIRSHVIFYSYEKGA